jgi:hypothetical protein
LNVGVRSRGHAIAACAVALLTGGLLALALSPQAGVAGLPRLAWAPPRLVDPITVRVGAPGTLKLDPSRDYVIRMPRHPVTGPGGLVISGGHDVVLVGGTIEIPQLGPDASIEARRGLYLADQTGTIHVEGIHIEGAGLSEGIDLSEPLGAIVQLENIRIDRLRARDEVHWTDNHPDLVQTWSGPAVLRIDGLSGVTDYQGLFLAPNQFAPQVPMRSIDVRRVNIVSAHACTCVLLWNASPFPAIAASDVWLAPTRGRSLASVLWPKSTAWPGARLGVPPTGPFVPAGTVGVGYRTPGYVNARR